MEISIYRLVYPDFQDRDGTSCAHESSSMTATTRHVAVTFGLQWAAAGSLFPPGSRELVSLFEFESRGETQSSEINFGTDPSLDADPLLLLHAAALGWGGRPQATEG